MNIGNGRLKWVLLVGGILVFLACAVLFGGTSLLRGNDTTANPNANTGLVTPTFPAIGMNEPSDSSTGLGEIVTASAVGAGNRPLDVTTNFPTNAPVIYAVAEAAEIPTGTTVFARWSRDGQPFEDTTILTADRNYQNTYIEFHISPVETALAPGTYAVQFFINGNPGPLAQFTVS